MINDFDAHAVLINNEWWDRDHRAQVTRLEASSVTSSVWVKVREVKLLGNANRKSVEVIRDPPQLGPHWAPKSLVIFSFLTLNFTWRRGWFTTIQR